MTAAGLPSAGQAPPSNQAARRRRGRSRNEAPRAAAIAPEVPAAAVVAARRALAAGDLDGAAALAGRHLRQHPRSAAARVVIARVHIARGDLDAAWRELHLAAAAHPRDVDVLYYLAQVSGQLAAEQFERLAEQSPMSARGHQVLAESLEAQERRSDAEREYQAALAAKPDLLDALIGLARLQRIRLDCDGAKALYARAEAVRPTFEAAYGIGACLLREQDHEAARAQLAKAVARDPTSVVALVGLGSALLGLNRTGEAIVPLERAVAIEPAMDDGWYVLGRAYQAAGRPTRRSAPSPPSSGCARRSRDDRPGGCALAESRDERAAAVLLACRGSASMAGAAPQSTRSPTLQAPPAPPNAAAGVRFVDRTEASGLAAFQHRSGTPEKRYVVETTGSGVALWDFDRDGRLDVYLVNGSTIDALLRGTPAPRAALFRNMGGGRFEDVTMATGTGNERWGQGVCAGDVDNDGFEDLYVTNVGVNRLFISQRGRTHVRGSSPRRPASPSTAGRPAARSATTTATAGSISTWPATSPSILRRLPPAPPAVPTAPRRRHRRPRQRAAGESGGRVGMGAALAAGAASCTYRGEPVMCGPLGLPGAPDHLFRNNRDGTFTDVTQAAGVAEREARFGFGVAWFDMDDDGRLDLFVANDSGPNHVYRNLGNGRFDDVGYASGAALDANGRTQAHMGVAVGDYDNDGRADLHVTNFADDYNILYRNHDGPSFSDVELSGRRRAAVHAVPRLGHGFPRLRQRWLARSRSSSTATSIRRPIACPGTPPTRSGRCCSATWPAGASSRSARRPVRP